MMLVPKRYFVTDGAGLSRVSPLNAFDQALRDAGIAHLNLVPVSSILPKGAVEVEREDIPPGAITFVVMAKAEGESGQKIAAGLAWAMGDKHGYVVECHGNEGDEVRRKLSSMMEEVERKSGMKFGGIKTRVRELKVPSDTYGCVIVALVLLL